MEPNRRSELLDRITEIARVTATTELWCHEAQTLLYDCRDFIKDETKEPGPRYVKPPYTDEARGQS